MDYVRGWAYQQCYLDRRLRVQREHKHLIPTADSSPEYDLFDRDRILLLEHNHVYTLGRGADEGNLTFLDTHPDGDEIKKRLSRKTRGPESCRLDASLLRYVPNSSIQDDINSISMPKPVFAPNGVPIYRIDRGGDVTYHGDSQLVVYPILDLRRDPYKQDLHWYLRCIEEVVIRVLKVYGIEGERDSINTGVWVGKNKIAAIGLSSARWITTHGFALNVDTNLDMFDASIIIPCGIEGRGVTSIADALNGSPPSLQEVASVVLEKVSEVFEVPLQTGEDLI
jgi:lipoate-protein ligase B|eukprot:scaffold10241_cov256-Chaetoceros_neogracile.AAC.16